MNAATTFNYPLPLNIDTQLSNVCTEDMYFMAPPAWVLCTFVRCTQTHVYDYVPLIHACVCVEREDGWLLPTAWQSYPVAWRHHHHSAGPSPRYVPRRAVLYCPGNDERKLRKLASLDVDCVVLDCEDGVALSKKVQKHTDASVQCSLARTGQQGPHKEKKCTDSCVILNGYNSISLLQTGARS